MNEPLVKVEHVTHRFPLTKKESLRAVDDVSFTIGRQEILGLVGESGCGKSTIARVLMNIYQPSAGRILFDGIDTTDARIYRANRQKLACERQMIFQDSASSLNPRMRVADIITEPLSIWHIKTPRENLRKEAAFQLHYIGLDESYLDKYPAQLSGGQRQRVAIARAVAMNPKLLVADEPIASLDVSIQAQIINLFSHLREEHGFSILFIAHDLAMVEYLCDRVGVLYHGRLVEIALTEDLYRDPRHPYTKALLEAIPYPDPLRERARTPIDFEALHFSTEGQLEEVAPQHFVLKK